MELKDMSIDELMERRAAIAEEVEAPEADLDALEEEARAIKDELEARKAAETKRAEIRSAVASGEGKVEKKIEVEERKEMTEKEIRNSAEYINAFANYIKTGDDKECRALLTLNATGGQVPVPEYVEGRVRAAWERNGLMELVTKTYFRGNLKVGFEISATGAVVHTEGTNAPDEETLTLGVVTLVPASIKKWIRISDETLDLGSQELGGQEFIDYIYDELTYQIAKAAANLLISKIDAAPATSSATAVGVASIAGDPSDLSVIAQAVAQLADDSDDITVVMNRGTHPAFISAMVQANYLFDPFDNVRVEYNNSLPVYADAKADETWMIVGDFRGAQANFPNGDEIRIKLDDMSEAEADLVKVVGREFVAVEVVKPGAFVKVTKNS